MLRKKTLSIHSSNNEQGMPVLRLFVKHTRNFKYRLNIYKLIKYYEEYLKF